MPPSGPSLLTLIYLAAQPKPGALWAGGRQRRIRIPRPEHPGPGLQRRQTKPPGTACDQRLMQVRAGRSIPHPPPHAPPQGAGSQAESRLPQGDGAHLWLPRWCILGSPPKQCRAWGLEPRQRPASPRQLPQAISRLPSKMFQVFSSCSASRDPSPVPPTWTIPASFLPRPWGVPMTPTTSPWP